MGNPKQKWTPEEEEALRRGILKHGAGKWKNIQRDPEFSPYLSNRSNIDLKDKWRNLTVNAAIGVVPRGSNNKSRAQWLKKLADSPATPLAVTQAPPMLLAPSPLAPPPPASSTPVSKDVKKVPGTEDPSKCNGKVVSEYNAMICEAISTLNDPNGSDSSSIIKYFEKKGEMPTNAQKFRKMLTSRFRRLVRSEKLVKLPNHCYKLKTEESVEVTKTPVPKPNNAQLKAQPPPQLKAQTPPQPSPQPIRGYLGDSIEEATLSAAFTVSDAENKSFVLAEAVRESERVAMMSEETEKMLHLAFEISNRSKPKRKKITCS